MRNVAFGHVIGLAAGLLALYLTGRLTNRR